MDRGTGEDEEKDKDGHSYHDRGDDTKENDNYQVEGEGMNNDKNNDRHKETDHITNKKTTAVATTREKESRQRPKLKDTAKGTGEDKVKANY